MECIHDFDRIYQFALKCTSAFDWSAIQSYKFHDLQLNILDSSVYPTPSIFQHKLWLHYQTFFCPTNFTSSSSSAHSYPSRSSQARQSVSTPTKARRSPTIILKTFNYFSRQSISLPLSCVSLHWNFLPLNDHETIMRSTIKLNNAS